MDRHVVIAAATECNSDPTARVGGTDGRRFLRTLGPNYDPACFPRKAWSNIPKLQEPSPDSTRCAMHSPLAILLDNVPKRVRVDSNPSGTLASKVTFKVL